MCLGEGFPKTSSVTVSRTRTSNTTSTNSLSTGKEKSVQRSLHNGELEIATNMNVHENSSVQALLDSFSSITFIVMGFIVSCAVFAFSLYFPFVLAPHAASKTYHLAFWKYDESLSHFDNTIWTYGTDYGLALVMAIIAVSILKCDDCKSSQVISSKLRWRSAGLLLSYSASVFAGAVAHQFYTTVESRDTLSFRFIWTICVGTVCGASAFMGCIASEVARQYRGLGPIPVIHENFWVSFGLTTTFICIMGGFSYQRPACDIFIAGITQFPSTFYMMPLLAIQCGHPSLLCSIRLKYRVMGLFGFILMAPMLPVYPLLVQYTDWSLASVNTLLHACLLMAWGTQGLCLRHLAVTLARSKQKPYHAVPVPLNKKAF